MGYSGANIGISQSIFFGLYVFAEYVMPRLQEKTSRCPTFWHVISCGQPNAINHTWGWLVYPTQNGTWG